MESPDSYEAPAYVPEAFQDEHLDEARRTVANSRGLRAAARRFASSSTADDPSVVVVHRWIPYVYGAHAVAALLALTFAVATATFGVGAFMVVTIGVSAVVTRALLRTLVRQHLASADHDTPSPPA